MDRIWNHRGQKVREAIFIYRVGIFGPVICVHCTTILERTADGFIFDIDGKSTQLISIRNGHFIMFIWEVGVLMSGMIPEWEGERG